MACSELEVCRVNSSFTRTLKEIPLGYDLKWMIAHIFKHIEIHIFHRSELQGPYYRV